MTVLSLYWVCLNPKIHNIYDTDIIYLSPPVELPYLYYDIKRVLTIN